MAMMGEVGLCGRFCGEGIGVVPWPPQRAGRPEPSGWGLPEVPRVGLGEEARTKDESVTEWMCWGKAALRCLPTGLSLGGSHGSQR